MILYFVQISLNTICVLFFLIKVSYYPEKESIINILGKSTPN